MTKSQGKAQDLREELKRIGEAKAPIAPRSRRYSDKEVEVILEAIDSLGFAEVHELSGVRDWTISKWRKRRAPRPPEVAPDHHDGYHKHWQKALDLWRSKPGLGPAQIVGQMRRDGIRISVSTVRSILEEHGYAPPKAKLKPERVFRYEAARPRELVHMDFKHFYIHKQKAFLLLMQDDYSRFLCGHRLTNSENIDDVTEVFETCVAQVWVKDQVYLTYPPADSSFINSGYPITRTAGRHVSQLETCLAAFFPAASIGLCRR